MEEAHFSRLYPGSRSFGHDPKFMAIGEGGNVDRLVNRELCFLAQLSLHHNGSARCYCGSRTDPSVDLPLHSPLTREQDPKILELLHLRQELPSNLKSVFEINPNLNKHGHTKTATFFN
ncbi:hypothetical protein XENORESO_005047 [Xenotaenia resolanae]|uniref:Uncharacterized protein n=1 Tax=Xenotaenia resolanae TaxID=208358 RepID=A0ABV0W5K1_9TELE